MKTRLTLVAAVAIMATANGAYAATAAGTQIINKASATYSDSTGVKTVESNTVVTTVQQVASLSLSAGTSKSGAAGATVSYPHTITNNSNAADSFTLSQTNAGVFQMANVQFFPDTNGDGIADDGAPAITVTPSVAVGGTYKFVAVATLPAGAATGATNALTVKAASVFANTVSQTAIDNTTVAAGAALDMTANGFGSTALGYGAYVDGGAALENKTTTAGTMTRFTLYLSNNGGTQDTFNLQASTDGSFGAQTLPEGWTVVFKDANNQVITAATVAAGAHPVIYAEVTPSAGATVGTTDIYFRAISGTTGVTDKIREAVTIAAANSLLELVKEQALDADCNGAIEGAFTKDPITGGAVPGACIRYRITATNKGATQITAVVMTDNIPANTVYHDAAAASTLLGSVLAPLNGLVGSVSANVGALNPGQSNTMQFGVKINP
ncbi:hypothetical protein [Massilia sp. YIM B02443]|uniref:hypothetical protein n=1 Tax=Massilia sp. YIM B02443 TaxID=3050127 RepID=UPI0025B71DE7|nr:hypothetical protein [Massilia sp. YIM B02443]MDN4037735.1 hypothetical protein [Massilia sp. YIM B02443]